MSMIIPQPQLAVIIRRFGLASSAVIVFAAASAMWEQGDMITNRLSVALALLDYGAAFGLILFAIHRHPGKSALRWIGLSLLLVFISFGQLHVLDTLHNGGVSTTDVHIFTDYAARLFRQGANPYAYDLLDANRINRTDAVFATPLQDDYFVGHLNYPALSFLIYVPFQILGMDTGWVFSVFMALLLIVVFLKTSELFRPIILLPLFADPRFLIFAFNGVSDIVWAFFLTLMALRWRHRTFTAICFGLACAFKQQPWLLAPFLAIRLWNETEGTYKDRLQPILKFSAIVLAVFFVLNLPFIAADPAAWLHGIAEPFTGNLILLGQGLSSLTMLGIVIAPKWLYTLLTLAVLGLCILVYLRRSREMPEAMWIFPALALWFAPRSLSSYWYFNLIPLFVAIVAGNTDDEPAIASSPRSTRPMPDFSGLISLSAVLIVVALLVFRLRPPEVSLQVLRPLNVFQNFVSNLSVSVSNTTNASLTPRFSVQSWTNQPFFWQIIDGPETLPSGQQAIYQISTNVPYKAFDMTRGAQVIVNDASNADFRASSVVPAVTDLLHPDVVPNGRYELWDPRTNTPYLWTLDASSTDHGQAALADQQFFDSVIRLTLRPNNGNAYDWVALDTFMALPDVPFRIKVNPPQNANLLPNLDLVYGLELLTPEHRIWILFGDQQTKGTLADGTRYFMLSAPRNQWSEYTIDLHDILQQLELVETPIRVSIPRFDHLDYLRVPLHLRLLLASHSAASPVQADFGAIESLGLKPNADQQVRFRLQNPELPLLWSASYLTQSRNYAEAEKDYQAAIQAAADPQPSQFQLAEFYFGTQRWQDALALYSKLLDGHYKTAQVNKGMGWSLYNLGQYANAADHFRRAIAALSQQPVLTATADLADAYGGLGSVLLKQNDCFEAAVAFEQATTRLPSYPSPTAELQQCLPLKR